MPAIQKKDAMLEIKGSMVMSVCFWKNLCHYNCAEKASQEMLEKLYQKVFNSCSLLLLLLLF